ncbi:MAG: YkgJ family cysteine cluster protein [Peptostreptococcaceae bacterium]
MRTTNRLEEISDGKLYNINDTVKADTCGCDGCNDCCIDVGDLVVLTPFDVYEMVNCLGIEFDELIGNKIELRENNKILLPYLKMQENNKRCSFLNEEGRCTIHSSRPNICRLFPLGRVYQNDNFKYFLQVGNCPKEDLSEVKVSKWIGIENYDENKTFVLEWYKFIKALTFRLKFVRDEKEIEEINKIILDNCYRIKIKEDENFYSSFFKELPKVKNILGII